jgi:hypothetical protein
MLPHLNPKDATFTYHDNTGRVLGEKMRSQKLAFLIIILTLSLGGCSTRPRYFVASLQTPAADTAQFESDLALCRELVGRGYKSNFKAQAAAIGLGTVASGVVVGAVQAAAINAAIINVAGGTASTAGVTALSVAVPFVGVAVGFGVSRIIRSGREKKLKRNLTNCLAEYNHTVEKWTPAKRPKLPRKGQQPEPDMPAPTETPAPPSEVVTADQY